MKLAIFALAAIAALQAVRASAGVVQRRDPQSVVRALQAAGYAAKLDKDKTGDPMIVSGSSGTTFHIYFYGCKDHKNCSTVQFSSGYNIEKALPLEQVNE